MGLATYGDGERMGDIKQMLGLEGETGMKSVPFPAI
jgi:hypothetical protein